ncbi:RNA polymerase sigma factor SigZ [Fulvivirga imtechensis AK7]|uniref:RNA polymerase sigma factor SigZ n=1 Tax=Fulvivirga imtechensis AK7 TaxID=1237149 RepID=L8JMS1_9BACT|nr:sigma-70 family RNA polymerase sigma factor [Fulvivirga imtechensis]ELR70221.1 RNA polymerase sigma factor SigZ [Fulvivirga imtechensis AK7]
MNNIDHIQSRFGGHLFNFIRSKVSSPDDAQDIYQEVILKLVGKSNQLKNAQSLKSWLFTIAKNQVIDFYRGRKLLPDAEPLPARFVADSDETNVYEELEPCLHDFIDQLPDDYRTIIRLSEIEGKSQKEISESLGLNYVTLRSKVQRGREKIRKMIFDTCMVEQDASGRFAGCVPKAGVQVCGNNSIEGGCD